MNRKQDNSGRDLMRCCNGAISEHFGLTLVIHNFGRRGAVLLEGVLVIPLLVIVVMAAFEFGICMIVEQAIVAAVVEGAREAAKVPTTIGAVDGVRVIDAVEAVEASILSTHGIGLSDVQIIVEDSSGLLDSGPAVGTVPGITGITDSAEVRVTVRVEIVKTRIPDLLATFGLKLTSRHFDVCSISRRD